MMPKYQEVCCAICGGQAMRSYALPDYDAVRYECRAGCGTYCIDGHSNEVYGNRDNAKAREGMYPERLRWLLRERSLEGRPEVMLIFDDESGPPELDVERIRVADLLERWPATIPERMERCLCSVVRETDRELRAGREFRGAHSGGVPFSLDVAESVYFLQSMEEYGWIERRSLEHRVGTTDDWALRVTPKGWAKFHEMQQQGGDARHPAFVAMWFGWKGKDPVKVDDMTSLFRDVITPACKAAGWVAERSDTPEHNEPIMDRVIAMIRKAPFVIAELTENNLGVYYEAGFARGLGKEVIYCCPDDTKPHFDISGLNQVRWSSRDELRKKLENRILGSSIGEGPYKA